LSQLIVLASLEHRSRAKLRLLFALLHGCVVSLHELSFELVKTVIKSPGFKRCTSYKLRTPKIPIEMGCLLSRITGDDLSSRYHRRWEGTSLLLKKQLLLLLHVLLQFFLQEIDLELSLVNKLHLLGLQLELFLVLCSKFLFVTCLDILELISAII